MKNFQPHETPANENFKTAAVLAVAGLMITASGFVAHGIYEVTHVQPQVDQIHDSIVGDK